MQPPYTRGGTNLSAVPFHNQMYKNFPSIQVGKNFTETERSIIASKGGATFGMTLDNTIVVNNEVPTTSNDASFSQLEFMDEQTTVREYFFNNIKRDCSQAVLTQGNLKAGIQMFNEANIRALFLQYYVQLSSPAYVITIDSEAAQSYFAENLFLSIDYLAGSVTAAMSVPMVTQLRTINIDFTAQFEQII
jgi:hypothetical protein